MMEENVLFLKTETKVLTVLQYVQCLKSTMLLYSSPVRPSILFIKVHMTLPPFFSPKMVKNRAIRMVYYLLQTDK